MNKFLTLVRSNLLPSATQGLNRNTKYQILNTKYQIQNTKRRAL